MINKRWVLEIFFRLDKWKAKAKQRAKEINALKKRNKEILESKEKIKSKNVKLVSQIEELENKNKQLELELKKIPDARKPKHHSYSITIIKILLTINLRTSSKFRTLEKDNKIRAEIIESYDECPSHVTIRNWVLK